VDAVLPADVDGAPRAIDRISPRHRRATPRRSGGLAL